MSEGRCNDDDQKGGRRCCMTAAERLSAFIDISSLVQTMYSLLKSMSCTEHPRKAPKTQKHVDMNKVNLPPDMFTIRTLRKTLSIIIY